MKKLALAVLVCFVAAPALAQGQGQGGGGDQKGTHFTPPKVNNEKEIRQSLDAMYKRLDEAMVKGDHTVEYGMIDFPVLMVTDSDQGDATSSLWTREQYDQAMSEVMKNTPPDANKKLKKTRSYDILSDDLAIVTTSLTDTVNGKKTTWKSATLMIRKNGQWMAKSMIEGGWGNSMLAQEFRQQGGNQTGTGGGGTGEGNDNNNKKK